MDLALPFALLALGFASGAHCLGMCGGIVGAFSVSRKIFPEKVLVYRQLAFNCGRITTYALAGLAAGALGSAGAYVAGVQPWQGALYVVTSLVLVGAGLQLAGVAAPLRWTEAAAAPLWRRVQPYAARLSAGNHPFAAGMAWGFLPCSLVYGALAAAVFAGSPARGALAMAAFGLGTLPWLIGAGLAAQRLRAAPRALRVMAGAAVTAFGLAGLAQAAPIKDLLCL